MDTKLVKIVLSCKTPEQIALCIDWIESLQTIDKADKTLLLNMLEHRRIIMGPLEVF